MKNSPGVCSRCGHPVHAGKVCGQLGLTPDLNCTCLSSVIPRGESKGQHFTIFLDIRMGEAIKARKVRAALRKALSEMDLVADYKIDCEVVG
jgi:hypothetical protein